MTLIHGPRAYALFLVASTAALLCAVAGCRAGENAVTVAAAESSNEAARAIREAALASARVWQPPAVPIGQATLNTNPPGADVGPDDDVNCRFNTKRVGGTTPKFHCDLPTGETVKLKYGQGNPELHAEVATTRLLTTLGFFADRMFTVRRVRCAGCPAFPFQSLRCLDRFGLKAVCFPRGIDYDRVVEFPAAVLERKLDGRVIEARADQGWGWYELDKIDPARGGSSRAEVDAFRLMAVFLAHWDNKDANQRLVCPAGADRPDGGCAAPIALMQDVGATFGPKKVELHNWRQTRIWKDGAGCRVSMEHLPYAGGTFPERIISEGGRRHLLGLLEQLSDRQLQDLFDASGITGYDQVHADARRAQAWVEVFKDKVQQIRDGGPCPS